MASIGKAGNIETALQGRGNLRGSGFHNGVSCSIHAGTTEHVENYHKYLWVRRTPLPMGLHCQHPLFIVEKSPGRSGQSEERTNTRTETGPSPAVTMHLDRQGLAVTYSEAASRPPQRTEAPSSKPTPGDVRLKLAAREKEKEAARATLE